MRSLPINLPAHRAEPACDFARAAFRALLVEVNLTPKPGLVDRHNTGAHRDMDLGHFYRSARAIGVWLPRFIQRGREDAALPAEQQLARLRPLGLACENQMFRATGSINTHKGSVFSLGLLCTAFGRLQQQGRAIGAEALCAEVAAMCRGLVDRELRRRAALLLAQGGSAGEAGLTRLRRFDADCIARNLSPGGSADLLIVTWLLAQLGAQE
ncbi:TPA: triphosphoribosyl-dephospho-CoA synthase [Serratia marcescens]|nr:triphosphoribosyl-dephospho-CoA synthase [Serratia marcescens]